MHGAALNRARAHNRHLDDEIVELTRPQTRQHAHLRARFNLEHPDGIGAANHVVRLFVFLWNVVHLEALAAPLGDEIERASDRRQHAEREHIDL